MTEVIESQADLERAIAFIAGRAPLTVSYGKTGRRVTSQIWDRSEMFAIDPRLLTDTRFPFANLASFQRFCAVGQTPTGPVLLLGQSQYFQPTDGAELEDEHVVMLPQQSLFTQTQAAHYKISDHYYVKIVFESGSWEWTIRFNETSQAMLTISLPNGSSSIEPTEEEMYAMIWLVAIVVP